MFSFDILFLVGWTGLVVYRAETPSPREYPATAGGCKGSGEQPGAETSGRQGRSRVEKSKEERDWRARDVTGKAASAKAGRIPESHTELSASAVKNGSTTVTASRAPGLQLAA